MERHYQGERPAQQDTEGAIKLLQELHIKSAEIPRQDVTEIIARASALQTMDEEKKDSKLAEAIAKSLTPEDTISTESLLEIAESVHLRPEYVAQALRTYAPTPQQQQEDLAELDARVAPEIKAAAKEKTFDLFISHSLDLLRGMHPDKQYKTRNTRQVYTTTRDIGIGVIRLYCEQSTEINQIIGTRRMLGIIPREMRKPQAKASRFQESMTIELFDPAFTAATKAWMKEFEHTAKCAGVEVKYVQKYPIQGQFVPPTDNFK